MRSKMYAVIMLLIATLFWGSTFPIMKVAIESLDPILFTALRFLVATLVLLIFFRRKVNYEKHYISFGLILSLMLVIGHITQIEGLKYTTPTKSAFITAMYVAFVPITSYMLIHEKPSTLQIISLGLAMFGLYLLTSPKSHGFNVGDLLTVLCAISFAFQITLVHKYSRDMDPLSLTFWETLFTFAFTFPLGLCIGSQDIPNINIFSILAILYIGIFPTALAFFIQMSYQKLLSSTSASLIYAMEPVFGHAFSFIFLGDRLSPIGYVGAVLIVMAMIIGNKS